MKSATPVQPTQPETLLETLTRDLAAWNLAKAAIAKAQASSYGNRT